jgi:hypothetical protein
MMNRLIAVLIFGFGLGVITTWVAWNSYVPDPNSEFSWSIHVAREDGRGFQDKDHTYSDCICIETAFRGKATDDFCPYQRKIADALKQQGARGVYCMKQSDGDYNPRYTFKWPWAPNVWWKFELKPELHPATRLSDGAEIAPERRSP